MPRAVRGIGKTDKLALNIDGDTLTVISTRQRAQILPSALLAPKHRVGLAIAVGPTRDLAEIIDPVGLTVRPAVQSAQIRERPMTPQDAMLLQVLVVVGVAHHISERINGLRHAEVFLGWNGAKIYQAGAFGPLESMSIEVGEPGIPRHLTDGVDRIALTDITSTKPTQISDGVLLGRCQRHQNQNA